MRLHTDYAVVVGNIGTVYEGSGMLFASRVFDEYVLLSKALYGRVSNEPVTMFANGSIVAEYQPENHNEGEE